MKFTPLTDDQLNAQRGILKEGEGTFEVVSALEKTSSSGNDMIELVLKVWDSEGKENQVFDYLVTNAQWKIKHFYVSIEKEEDYNRGILLPSDIIGTSGKCKIGIQKDTTGKYGDRSKIKDYLVADGAMKEAKKVFETDATKTFQDTDDIPF